MKASELRAMDVGGLKTKEKELREELFNLRMQKSLGQAENPVRIRFIRRDIARVKTIIADKERGR